MALDDFVRVAALEDIPPGRTLCVEIGDREILLCNTAEGLYAVDNLCTHAAARLCEGKLKGQRVICPLHGAAFDVRDGSALTRPASIALQTYRLRQVEDSVEIQLPAGVGGPDAASSG